MRIFAKYFMRFKNFLTALPLYGNGRFCPVCGKSSRRFQKYGSVAREDARCPYCGALERHRLFWLYISRRTSLFDGASRKMLHVAPEACFASRFKALLGDGYLTADLFDPNAMTKMDITDIKYPPEYFDVIICNDVLEHVQNDKLAMREFFRVLKSNGWAILLVPVYNGKTSEDPTITDPAQRLVYFGQSDHVRKYGQDYVERLQEAGFNVEIAGVNDLASGEDVTKMGLAKTNRKIYFCTRPDAGQGCY